MELYIRSYTDPQVSVPMASLSLSNIEKNKIEEIPTPSNNTSAVLPMAHSALEGEEALPLGEGILTNNWGVGIVVVCTKVSFSKIQISSS